VVTPTTEGLCGGCHWSDLSCDVGFIRIQKKTCPVVSVVYVG
jgi:hypothetical protein